MDLDQIVKKKIDFATKQVGGELVLVPIKDNVAEMNEMFTLNDVGTLIWENLVDGCAIDTLSDSVVEAFEIDKETAIADVGEFLGQLEKMMNG
ncbi:PqqD family protein [Bacteroidota bacterium]